MIRHPAVRIGGMLAVDVCEGNGELAKAVAMKNALLFAVELRPTLCRNFGVDR